MVLSALLVGFTVGNIGMGAFYANDTKNRYKREALDYAGNNNLRNPSSDPNYPDGIPYSLNDNLNNGDAFRHGYSSARSTFELGETVSRYSGYLVEGVELFTRTFEGDGTEESAFMDIHNNTVGRNIGLIVKDLAEKNNWNDIEVQNEIGRRVQLAIENNEMIIIDINNDKKNSNIDDPRIKETKDDFYSTWNIPTAKEISDFYNYLQNNGFLPFNLLRPDITTSFIDPLVLDLNGDGIELTAAEDGSAYFDIDADGFRERVGWVSAEDGLLVRDLNGNGTIDDISELIGNDEQHAYAVLDGLDQNNDNKINENDAVWNSLQVWQDANSNGVTDAGELKSLADHKITEFSMREQYVWDEDNGNHVFASGSFVKDGETQETQAVFFDTQQEHTVFDYPDGWVASDAVQALPTLSGGGRVNPLDCMINQEANNHILPTFNHIAA